VTLLSHYNTCVAIVAHVKWQVYEKTFVLSAYATMEMQQKIHNQKKNIYI